MHDSVRIAALVDQVLPRVRALRHAFHRHPEIANEEFETASRIRSTLAPLPVRVLKPYLQTDVVALLEGRGAGRCVALRADIDALPLEERTGLPYRSRIPNRMHACGHDGHTAMLCGAAMVLSRLRGSFDGTVRLVFQPGEENVAAGRDLIAAGALERPGPRAQAAVALHGWGGHAVGQIAARPGLSFANASMFRIDIRGKGAHGSQPHQAVDPILTGVRIVEALQSIPAGGFNPLEPLVVQVTRFEAGHTSNVIPADALLEGTVRAFDAAVARGVPGQMRRIIDGVCRTTGATAKLRYVQPYVPLHNDAPTVRLGKRISRSLFGRGGWQDVRNPSLGGEDFAYFLRKCPGAMFRLGLGPKCAPGHSPYFDFNDAALRNGVLFLVSMTLELLRQQPE
jgi:amidohydrolase